MTHSQKQKARTLIRPAAALLVAAAITACCLVAVVALAAGTQSSNQAPKGTFNTPQGTKGAQAKKLPPPGPMDSGTFKGELGGDAKGTIVLFIKGKTISGYFNGTHGGAKGGVFKGHFGGSYNPKDGVMKARFKGTVEVVLPGGKRTTVQVNGGMGGSLFYDVFTGMWSGEGKLAGVSKKAHGHFRATRVPPPPKAPATKKKAAPPKR